MLGILGGMGPLAGVDLARKIVSCTAAERDDEHIPFVLYSNPQIPDRVEALLNDGVDPFPAMLQGLEFLRLAGADRVAIACNTAHYWYDQLGFSSGMPLFHIVDATIRELNRLDIQASTIGILASDATIQMNLYSSRLSLAGYKCIHPRDQVSVMAAIRLVKAGELNTARTILDDSLSDLISRGCKRILMACTEIPLALAASDFAECILSDPTIALARECIQWHRQFKMEDSARPITKL